jgi:hypothetical protein
MQIKDKIILVYYLDIHPSEADDIIKHFKSDDSSILQYFLVNRNGKGSRIECINPKLIDVESLETLNRIKELKEKIDEK